jgi:hypothetical protein
VATGVSFCDWHDAIAAIAVRLRGCHDGHAGLGRREDARGSKTLNVGHIGSEAAFGALSLLVFRALPVVVALVLHSSTKESTKIASLVGYGALVFVARWDYAFRPVEVLSAYAWSVPAAICLFVVSSRIRASRPMLFALAAGLLLIAPGVFVRHDMALVLGWEAALSAFSYCAEQRGERRSLGEYLTFVYVNPVLLFSQRGANTSAVAWDLAGVGRILEGLLRVGAAITVFAIAASLPRAGVLADATKAITNLSGLYLAHTGLASTQIGLARQVGICPPERYLQPMRATSPADFWARWNIYVGGWIRAYVFNPISKTLLRARARGQMSRRVAVGLAVTCAFLAVGLLHDLHATLARREISVHWTAWFLVNAAVVLVWGVTIGRARTLPPVLSRAALFVVALALAAHL